MEKISRRKFLNIFGLASLSYPFATVIAASKENQPQTKGAFPITIAVLRSAYEEEKITSDKYIRYSQKAVEEKYPNIAYLFTAFAASEKIHAKNYKRILAELSTVIVKPEFDIQILDTRTNLLNASKGELKKIRETYPNFLAKLKKESHDKAVVNCMYSWKSHQQHKRKISDIEKYSKYFFGHVARRIEGLKLDFHVCEICGSTIDEPPRAPCDVCNYPSSHYRKVNKPT
jgi:rubrerythrin